MGALFSKPKVIAPTPNPVVTRDETQLQLDAADRLRKRGLGGRASTLLSNKRRIGSSITGGLGASDLIFGGASSTGTGGGNGGTTPSGTSKGGNSNSFVQA